MGRDKRTPGHVRQVVGRSSMSLKGLLQWRALPEASCSAVTSTVLANSDEPQAVARAGHGPCGFGRSAAPDCHWATAGESAGRMRAKVSAMQLGRASSSDRFRVNHGSRSAGRSWPETHASRHRSIGFPFGTQWRSASVMVRALPTYIGIHTGTRQTCSTRMYRRPSTEIRLASDTSCQAKR